MVAMEVTFIRAKVNKHRPDKAPACTLGCIKVQRHILLHLYLQRAAQGGKTIVEQLNNLFGPHNSTTRSSAPWLARTTAPNPLEMRLQSKARRISKQTYLSKPVMIDVNEEVIERSL